jgi:hypothetical protein
MDSSVSPKEDICFLRVCHHVSNAVYNPIIIGYLRKVWYGVNISKESKTLNVISWKLQSRPFSFLHATLIPSPGLLSHDCDIDLIPSVLESWRSNVPIKHPTLLFLLKREHSNAQFQTIKLLCMHCWFSRGVCGSVLSKLWVSFYWQYLNILNRRVEKTT